MENRLLSNDFFQNKDVYSILQSSLILKSHKWIHRYVEGLRQEVPTWKKLRQKWNKGHENTPKWESHINHDYTI